MSSSARGIFDRGNPGSFGWPILWRQLRGDFRKGRFFLSHFACLCILGITLIALISHEAVDTSKTATQIGQGLFKTFFFIQYWIILIIFPAFSSTAFSEERAVHTMDLLLSSTLRPSEIVSGKLLASTVYCLIYVIGSIPLLSISFLFGGIEMADVLLAYVILIGMTLLVSMLGVCISSFCSSSIRATITVYVIVLALLGASYYVHSAIVEEASHRSGPNQSLMGALSSWGGPGFSLGVWHLALAPAVIFVYLFLVTANRIRPAADDRSSGLRALALFTALGLLAAGLAGRVTWAGGRLLPSTNAADWFKDLILQSAILFVLAAITFSTEDAAVSRKNRLRFGRLRGLLYPLRIFAPGAFWGAVFSFLLSLLVCGILLLVWKCFFVSNASQVLDHVVTEALFTLPAFVAAVAALGFLLAASDFTPYYSRLTVTFILIITSLLPMIWMLSKERDVVWTDRQSIWRGLYLSPVAIWCSLDPVGDDKSLYFLYGAPIAVVARMVFEASTVALFAAGVYLSKRMAYPMLRFSSPRSPPARPPR